MNTGNRQKGFIDPEQLSAVENMELRARYIVEGLMAGMHRSPYHGFSTEFLEYRDYREEEPARLIDWKKYAKTDKPYVKVYEDETNLYALILLDKSASMGFRSEQGSMSKYEYGATLAAAIAWIFTKQRDSCSLMLFDDKIRKHVSYGSTMRHYKKILSALQDTEASSGTGGGEVINTAAASLKRRGLCVLISDLFDDINELEEALKHLFFRRQEIIVIQVLDPFERDFSEEGDFLVRDSETGEEIKISGETASGYQKRGLKGHNDEVNRICLEMGIEYESVYTSEPFEKSLMRVFEKRRFLF